MAYFEKNGKVSFSRRTVRAFVKEVSELSLEEAGILFDKLLEGELKPGKRGKAEKNVDIGALADILLSVAKKADNYKHERSLAISRYNVDHEDSDEQINIGNFDKWAVVGKIATRHAVPTELRNRVEKTLPIE